VEGRGRAQDRQGRRRHRGDRALGQRGKLTTEVVRQDPLMAPIAKGQSMGCSRSAGADVVAEVPLVALEAVRGGRLLRPSCGTPSASGSSKFPGGAGGPAAAGAQCHATGLCSRGYEGWQGADFDQAGTFEGFSEFPKGFTFSL
jgi:hypothetical protein